MALSRKMGIAERHRDFDGGTWQVRLRGSGVCGSGLTGGEETGYVGGYGTHWHSSFFFGD